jgi:heme-degrading monooxygenase HmoA
MYSRIVNCTIKPALVNEFKSKLNDELLPRIQAQPGFIENIESLDAATGQFSCVTLWESSADVEKYHNGLFQEVTENLIPLLEGSPTVQTLPVENSSAHNVKLGAAAA